MRPKKKRRIDFRPNVVYFKPRGVPLRILKEEEVNHDELEALRLKYVKALDQVDCAKKMNISQSTFQRILAGANKKVAQGLVKGKAIKINL
ncbi:MAG: DUF134 domain-containing protein [Candidatus Moranbacteria bacterium]|nr:DUF134 domain-containing protein [Candidatus Moranbacteria bacterium]